MLSVSSRKAGVRIVETLNNAIAELIDRFSLEECHDYIRSPGYASVSPEITLKWSSVSGDTYCRRNRRAAALSDRESITAMQEGTAMRGAALMQLGAATAPSGLPPAPGSQSTCWAGSRTIASNFVAATPLLRLDDTVDPASPRRRRAASRVVSASGSAGAGLRRTANRSRIAADRCPPRRDRSTAPCRRHRPRPRVGRPRR